ncbi:MAG: sulfate reduction electron transfer complex DsrMKJOP subunit DsrM [Dehalococcoidia bacterium]
MNTLFGVIIPYVAIAIFFLGFLYRIFNWSRTPVPFRIPTTCGQQKSLSWIKPSYLDNPPTTLHVTGRMILEIFLFRSLWRNTKTEVKPAKQKLIHSGNKWLWLFGLLFHISLLIIVVRHLSRFIEPVPWALKTLETLDGAFEFAVPTLFITDILILLALTYLLLRRIVFPQLRYISLPSDYFALFLLLGSAATGICLRLWYHTDIVAAKDLAMSVLRFQPDAPDGLSWLFYLHVTMVSVLFAYFPFSKMVHAGGIFFSPTRNMANNNRVKRHVNPWDYPVEIHTYEEYEEEYRDKMKAAGLPLEKE